MSSRSVRARLGDRLRRFRNQPEAEHAPGDRQARVIAVAARKGGVGKTTTAVNLACALASNHNQQVLLIDLDAQGHVGAALRSAVGASGVRLAEVLLSDRPRDILDAVIPTRIDGLHITASDKSLGEAEAQLVSRIGRETVLQIALRTAITRYDTILLDCPPMLGTLTHNALVAAESVLVPCDMSILALEGVADLLDAVAVVQTRLRHPIDVLGILRTRYDGRNTALNASVEEALEANFGDWVLETVIPVNSALAKAQAAGESIFDYAPRARGAVAYRDLAAELMRSWQAG
jgi:chromosome partitioning protein